MTAELCQCAVELCQCACLPQCVCGCLIVPAAASPVAASVCLMPGARNLSAMRRLASFFLHIALVLLQLLTSQQAVGNIETLVKWG